MEKIVEEHKWYGLYLLNKMLYPNIKQRLKNGGFVFLKTANGHTGISVVDMEYVSFNTDSNGNLSKFMYRDTVLRPDGKYAYPFKNYFFDTSFIGIDDPTLLTMKKNLCLPIGGMIEFMDIFKAMRLRFGGSFYVRNNDCAHVSFYDRNDDKEPLFTYFMEDTFTGQDINTREKIIYTLFPTKNYPYPI